MELPLPVKVGPYLIRFKWMDEGPETGDDVEVDLGQFDMDKENIMLHPILVERPTFYLEVVLHELTHAINEVYGVSEDHHSEEKMTKQQARGWAQVVKDNPAFWEWIRTHVMH